MGIVEGSFLDHLPQPELVLVPEMLGSALALKMDVASDKADKACPSLIPASGMSVMVASSFPLINSWDPLVELESRLEMALATVFPVSHLGDGLGSFSDALPLGGSKPCVELLPLVELEIGGPTLGSQSPPVCSLVPKILQTKCLVHPSLEIGQGGVVGQLSIANGNRNYLDLDLCSEEEEPTPLYCCQAV